jgi:hypothetical protein
MNISVKTTLILLILISTAFVVGSITTMTTSTGEQTVSCENNGLIKFIVNQDLIHSFYQVYSQDFETNGDGCITVCNTQGCYEVCP